MMLEHLKVETLEDDWIDGVIREDALALLRRYRVAQ